MPRWRFVHAADLHLDSPFVGLQEVQPDLARELLEATFASFRGVVDLCLEAGAEFLLLAGGGWPGGAVGGSPGPGSPASAMPVRRKPPISPSASPPPPRAPLPWACCTPTWIATPTMTITPPAPWRTCPRSP